MRITIPIPDGACMEGTLRRNRSAKNLLVICYGYKGSADQPAIQTIATDLHGLGYDILTFTFSASAKGGSLDIRGQVNDMKAIADYFAPKYDHVVLLAGSLGALSAAIATAQSRKVGGLVTLNGFFGLPHLGRTSKRIYWLFRSMALFNRTLRHTWLFYKQAYRPWAIRVPVLVMHAKNDTEVLPVQSKHFYDQLTAPKDFKALMLTDHEVSQTTDAHKVSKIIAKWLAYRQFEPN